MGPILPRLRRGQTPSAEEWNALVEAFDQMRPAGTFRGDIGVGAGGGGLQVLDGRDKGHWAKIGVGSGANYAHVQVVPNGDGTFTDLPSTFEYAYGTTTDMPAREVNGSESVAEGTYVWVWPDPVGTSPGWLFDRSDCCGTGADYYSWRSFDMPHRGVQFGPTSAPNSYFHTATVSKLIYESLLTIPAGTERVVVTGGVSALVALGAYNYSHAGGGPLGPPGAGTVVVRARLRRLTAPGSPPTTGTFSSVVCCGQIIPTGTAGYYYVTGDMNNSNTLPVIGNAGGGNNFGMVAANWFGESTNMSLIVPQAAGPQYFIWELICVVVAGLGDGGSMTGHLFYPGGSGEGRCHLEYRTLCCEDDVTPPIIPPAPPPQPPNPKPIPAPAPEPAPRAEFPPTENADVLTLEPLGTGEAYYATKVGSRANFYLSDRALAGEKYKIVGQASGGWEILQRAGMQIHGFDSTDAIEATTVGTGGSIRGPQYSTVELECIVDGTTFAVVSFSGPLTWI